MRGLSLILSVILAASAIAGVDDALDDHILPGFAAFETAATGLAEAAAADCRPEAVAPAYHDAFDAWLAVSDLRVGPSETGALSLSFWPDPRGSTRRTLARLIAEDDPVVRDPDGFADVSIAARGFFALDMLLFDDDMSDDTPGSVTCNLVTTIAADIAHQAEALNTAWSGDVATALREAGAEGNATYLTEDEALRAIYTQILSSLEFTADTRLGLPMGTFDRPRPARAEARRSGRPLRNIMLANEAAYALATALADHDLPQTDAAYARVQAAQARIADPTFADVADPQARILLESLQRAVRDFSNAIETEVGAPLGITPGFNSQDGD
jgi:hypothetical protein